MCAPSDRLPPFKLMLRFVSPAIDEEFAFLKEFEKGEYRNHTSMDSYKNIHSKYCNRIYQVKFFFQFNCTRSLLHNVIHYTKIYLHFMSMKSHMKKCMIYRYMYRQNNSYSTNIFSMYITNVTGILKKSFYRA